MGKPIQSGDSSKEKVWDLEEPKRQPSEPLTGWAGSWAGCGKECLGLGTCLNSSLRNSVNQLRCRQELKQAGRQEVKQAGRQAGEVEQLARC